MNWKWIYAIFGFVVLSSVIFAMSGATVSGAVERGRWAGLTAGSYTTEGGNITGINVSTSMLTDRWASFYGNVTGGIRLTDSSGVNDVYAWTWSATSGGEVCLSQNQTFPWASATSATAAGVDTAWGFTGAADSAANTYVDSNCSLTINEVAGAISSTGTYLQGSSSFENCVLDDGGAGEANYAFCTNISSSGTNWNGEAANYEIMVPTTPGAGQTETYYFFVELN